MSAANEFVSYLLESLEHLEGVKARRMFGGHGLFYQGLMWGLVADDELFLKADTENAPEFDALSLSHFFYEKQGKQVKLSYRRAPEEALEDPDVLQTWMWRAYQAALRARS